MDTQVKLNGPFLYSGLPILIAALIIIGLGIWILVLIFKNRENKVRAPKPVVNRNIHLSESDKSGVKARYFALLDNLVMRLEKHEIEFRPAFQELSKIIRDFVKEISGVDLTRSTLSEMKQKNIPVVSELIETYYEPEFAVETDDDVFKAIDGARKVIERWN